MRIFCEHWSLILGCFFRESILKEVKSESVWGELEAEKSFHRQPFTKFLRLNPASMLNSALQEKFNFCFLIVFC